MNNDQQILTAAKELVEAKNEYICYAITQAGDALDLPYGLLKEKVQAGIAPYGTLDSWLSQELGIDRWWRNEPHLSTVTLCRMAWLDKLILEAA